ncbi:MAG TPA: uroporphyrinogen-III synthase [Acidobacteriaceae bacterium]|nr:uroporphyrinogen-III synthase [Acidobacteriaceae bacterium]
MDRAKTVLVTRAPHQGSALADELRALHLEPILIPAIETVPPGSWTEVDAALAAITASDWILFTSANAVQVFSARRPPPPAGGMPKIAAIGASTARALADVGLPVDLVPARAVAEAFAEALLPYAKRADGSPTRFLWLRAEQGRDYLPDTLRAAGAEVNIVAAYRTVIPAGSASQLRDLLHGPTAHLGAATFTSSSTARNLYLLCDAAQLKLPESVARVSIGPVTSQTLRELGWPPHAEAPEATVAALAETVASVLRRRSEVKEEEPEA